MENKRRFMINMIANIVSFVVSLGISFFVAPFIIKNLGMEANGFVALANNFINYASVLIIALNSMAGRYITIAIHKGDMEEANKYFTSIVIANIFISLILLIPSVFLVIFLENVINIPAHIVWDVKILFSLIFLTYMLSIIGTSFSVATFATNRLDLSSRRNIESNILRAVVIYLLFKFLPPHIFYIGIISLIVTLYVFGANLYYTKKLIPDIKVKKVFFDIKKIFEIVKSGMWNTVTKFGQILSDGLDLLITNLFISPLVMGQLALSKTLPTIVVNLVNTISSLFQPNLTKYYANGDNTRFIKELKFSMKISGFFTNIPLCFIIIFGYYFFKLWIPAEDYYLINLLSIISISSLFFLGVLDPIWGVFTITNKLKVNSFMIIFNGLLNAILVFGLLYFTDLGVFAVVGVSTVTSTIRNLTFTPMYACHCLGIDKKTFYPIILRYVSVTSLMCFAFYVLSLIVLCDTWLKLFLICGACGLLGAIINYILLFNKEEKNFFVKDIVDKLRHKKEA